MRVSDTGKSAKEIKALTDKYMIETYERFDFITDYVDGNYMYDDENNSYLDFYGGVAVNSTGNRNPKVVEAIKNQVDDVIHTFNYPYTVPQALLAELICTTIGMEKIFFQNSGTEANEAMIKLARKYGIDNYGEHKYEIITALNSFHGRTYGAMSATGQEHNAIQNGFKPMVPGFSYGTFNDVESFENLVTDNTIAIMLEPIQGEGGIIPATPEFMEGIKQLCDKHNLLLLFDEIQTGWCRTGEIMAFQHYGIVPDILTMAKAMGGGMPIGAMCTTSKLAKVFSMGAHGSTYGGNSLACAASLAQIKELLDGEYAQRAKNIGDYLIKKLSSLPNVKEVRGKGLMLAVEFLDIDALSLKKKALSKTLLTTAVGIHTLRLVPPLTITEDECDIASQILNESINELSSNKEGAE
ncbi:acetylornithine/succinylornithine family transaminase [Vagococcus sp. PNs007]|uniref:Acetylornithine/succinylornithine family transaminase n=1 Tax=Vagococcus proximus TaxID=2991417 RepID=A0ABT5X389_9ENTE|nr:acetylornithine/succinylornithine family transaminase [Vagococcus proximus]MDF0480450.1 acetylornithine/succinylornithine family transaminase [Vagococcus proximus]